MESRERGTKSQRTGRWNPGHLSWAGLYLDIWQPPLEFLVKWAGLLLNQGQFEERVLLDCAYLFANDAYTILSAMPSYLVRYKQW